MDSRLGFFLLFVGLIGCQPTNLLPFEDLKDESTIPHSSILSVGAPAGQMRWSDFQENETHLVDVDDFNLLHLSWSVEWSDVLVESDASHYLMHDMQGNWIGLTATEDLALFALRNASGQSAAIRLVCSNDHSLSTDKDQDQIVIRNREDASEIVRMHLTTALANYELNSHGTELTVTVKSGSHLLLQVGAEKRYEHRIGDADELIKGLNEVAHENQRSWSPVLNRLEIASFHPDIEERFFSLIHQAYWAYTIRDARFIFSEPFLKDRASMPFVTLMQQQASARMVTSLGEDVENKSIGWEQKAAQLPIWLADTYFKEYRQYDPERLFQITTSNLGSIGMDLQVRWAHARMAFVLKKELDANVDMQNQKPIHSRNLLAQIEANPHDIRSVIAVAGGAEAFVDSLDAYLDNGDDKLDIQSQMGYLFPYLYNFAGAPWKAQERVFAHREAVEKAWLNSGPKDESTRWIFSHIFSQLGLYPVNHGDGVYVIGSPALTKATLHLPDGRTFRIRARFLTAENKYVQTASLNEQPLTRCYLRHFELMDGGELVLEMGPNPNYLHWIDEEALPPSASDPESDAW